jgi:hypothetical protein
MIGDHHDRTAGRTTLLASPADKILGTHRKPLIPRAEPPFGAGNAGLRHAAWWNTEQAVLSPTEPVFGCDRGSSPRWW